MEAQESKTVVERALVSYSGTSTGDGAGGGTTVVCSALTGLPDYDGLTIIITEGAYTGQSRDINGSTTGGTINVEPAFGGQIVSGINFSILTGMPAYSELVDIMGAAFDTSTDSLVKLHDDHLAPISVALTLRQPLAYHGVIDSIPAANQFIVAEFIGLGAGKFMDGTLPWQVYVLKDAAGTGIAPQGEIQPVTVFNSATGQIDHSAFTVALTADDEIYLLHPSLAHIDFSTTEKSSINTEVDNALDTALPGSPTAGSINDLIKKGLVTYGTVSDAAAAAGDFDTDLTEATNDHYNNMVIVFTDGVLSGQARRISDYVGGAKNIAVTPAFTEAPGDGDAFVIMNAYLLVMAERLDTQAKADVNAEVDSALNTAIPGSPTANSINELIKGLGDFEGLTNFSTLLALLGIPDTSGKPLYTVLVTDLLGHGTHGLVQLEADLAAIAGYIDTEIGTLVTVTDPKVMGKLQVAATTINLAQAAATYDLFTGTTQDVVLERLLIRLPDVDVSNDANITSISIQTDDTTPSVIISATDGAKANLTAEAQLGYLGIVMIKSGTKIRLTIAGGAADAATVCDVIAEYRAKVSGGYLA